MRCSRYTTTTGLLAALIFTSGALKLPGLVPGTEFQLSAPLAVAVCAVFGFRQYIIAGGIASLLGLVLGTQSFINVLIAMIFRLVVGGLLSIGGTSWPVVAAAGPIGTLTARLALGVVIGKAAVPLIVAAMPGMAYTACTAWLFTSLLHKIRFHTGRRLEGVVQR